MDDDAAQLKLNQLHLKYAGFEVDTAAGAHEALQIAKQRIPDAVMSDVLMGDIDGFGLCRLMREETTLRDVPVILLSAHYQEDIDQQLAARVGACALVQRTPHFEAEMEALRRSLGASTPVAIGALDAQLYEQHLRTNANQLTKLLGQAKNAEERYRTLFANAKDAITVLSTEGVVIDVNERWRDLLGVDPQSLIGRSIKDFAAPGHDASNAEAYRRSMASGSGDYEAVPLQRPDGRVVYVEFSNTVVELDGKSVVLSIGRDVTKNVEAARMLAATEAKYRSLVERMPEVVWTADEDLDLTLLTANIESLCAFTQAELHARGREFWRTRVHVADLARVAAAYDTFFATGAPLDIEYRWQRGDNAWIWLRDRAIATKGTDGRRRFDGMLSDVSERKRLEESFRQSQKMEAIGQLTGGIAHDFNNILAAILANSHFLIEELPENDPRRSDATEIKIGVERAAALTRQLLAFSRRQVLEPTIVDLNSILRSLEKMLRRLIGADIDFSVKAGASLGSIRVDVGQLEQVVMNLVVNARDAMPHGGTISIETSNVELEDTPDNTSGLLGRHVLLTVRDTGCGMDAETKRRIFEPFFTTKELGVGTGLGLSTCYGIVKQSGGHIAVVSEPGQGALFKVYLPRVEGSVEVARKRADVMHENGTETILIVEDDARVRAAVTRMLEPRGYHLLVARNGVEAMEVAKRYDGPIHLVLSDVVMPGSNGFEVVARVRERSATAQAIFMSGYTDHALLRDVEGQSGVNFIQKPFAPETLALKVWEVLNA